MCAGADLDLAGADVGTGHAAVAGDGQVTATLYKEDAVSDGQGVAVEIDAVFARCQAVVVAVPQRACGLLVQLDVPAEGDEAVLARFGAADGCFKAVKDEGTGAVLHGCINLHPAAGADRIAKRYDLRMVAGDDGNIGCSLTGRPLVGEALKAIALGENVPNVCGSQSDAAEMAAVELENACFGADIGRAEAAQCGIVAGVDIDLAQGKQLRHRAKSFAHRKLCIRLHGDRRSNVALVSCRANRDIAVDRDAAVAQRLAVQVDAHIALDRDVRSDRDILQQGHTCAVVGRFFGQRGEQLVAGDEHRGRLAEGELRNSVRAALGAVTVFVKAVRLEQRKVDEGFVARLIGCADILRVREGILAEVVIAVLVLRQVAAGFGFYRSKVGIRYAENDLRCAVGIHVPSQHLFFRRDQRDYRLRQVGGIALGCEEGHIARLILGGDVDDVGRAVDRFRGVFAAFEREESGVVIGSFEFFARFRPVGDNQIAQLDAVRLGVEACVVVAVVGGADLNGEAAAHKLVKGDGIVNVLSGENAGDGDGRSRGVREQVAVGRAADGADRLLEVGRFLRMVIACVVAARAARRAVTVFIGMIVWRDLCAVRIGELREGHRSLRDKRPIGVVGEVNVLALVREQQVALGEEAADQFRVLLGAQTGVVKAAVHHGRGDLHGRRAAVKHPQQKCAMNRTVGDGQASGGFQLDGAGLDIVIVAAAFAAGKLQIFQHGGAALNADRIAVAVEELRLTGFKVEGVIDAAVFDRDVRRTGDLEDITLRLCLQRFPVEVKREAAGFRQEIFRRVVERKVAQELERRAGERDRSFPRVGKVVEFCSGAVFKRQGGDKELIMAVAALAVLADGAVRADHAAGTFVGAVRVLREAVGVLRHTGFTAVIIVRLETDHIARCIDKAVALRQQVGNENARLHRVDAAERAAGQLRVFSGFINVQTADRRRSAGV